MAEDVEDVPVVAAYPFWLSEGVWGATVESGDAAEGDTVELCSRFGVKRLVTITEVIWQGDSSALVRFSDKGATE